MDEVYDKVFNVLHLNEVSDGINASFVDLRILLSLAVHADSSTASKFLFLFVSFWLFLNAIILLGEPGGIVVNLCGDGAKLEHKQFTAVTVTYRGKLYLAGLIMHSESYPTMKVFT